MRMDLGVCILRPFEAGDAASIAALANNREIWLNLRDRFPHPYTLQNAEAFIQDTRAQSPLRNFAVDVGGRAVGSIMIFPQTDISRVSAEVGYWLGQPYWGRGIMPAAVKAMTQYAIATFRLTRVFAVIGAHNTGSMRVLEKAGFVREGHMKQSSIKDGVIQDEYLYGFYA